MNFANGATMSSPESPLKDKSERYHMSIMPHGCWWIDRRKEIEGDYIAVAFLSFSDLKLKIYDNCPEEYHEVITRQAAEFQSMKGKEYKIKESGKVVILGNGIR